MKCYFVLGIGLLMIAVVGCKQRICHHMNEPFVVIDVVDSANQLGDFRYAVERSFEGQQEKYIYSDTLPVDLNSDYLDYKFVYDSGVHQVELYYKIHTHTSASPDCGYQASVEIDSVPNTIGGADFMTITSEERSHTPNTYHSLSRGYYLIYQYVVIFK